MPIPKFILYCGLFTTAVALSVLWIGRNERGTVWLMIPVCILGLTLVGYWLYISRRDARREAAGETVPPELPGPWYPYAIGGIAVALLVMVKFWSRK